MGRDIFFIEAGVDFILVPGVQIVYVCVMLGNVNIKVESYDMDLLTLKK